MRYSRHLKGNKGTETPTNIVFVDTEFTEHPNDSASDGASFHLRLWEATRIRFDRGTVSRRVEASGETADEFHLWLSSVSEPHRCTWIFAHNIYVDVTVLAFWRKLDEGYYTFAPKFKHDKAGNETDKISWRGKLCAEDRPFFMQFRHGDTHFKAVDSMNYWPVSLATVAESVGLNKTELPGPDDDESTWRTRCRQDVLILETAMIRLLQMWRAEKCGVWQMTAPALALTNFRHTCDVRTPDGEYLDIEPHPNTPQAKIERESYYGGRVQPFYVGKIDARVYHLDVNSLYPAMMYNHQFPRRYVAMHHNLKPRELLDMMGCYGAVAQVYIQSMGDSYPVKINGKQYHVCGEYFTTLAGPELLHALSTNSVKSVLVACTYSMAPLFRSWVEYWYSRKLSAKQRTPPDLAEYEFTKLIITSLSGKWSQKGNFWKDDHTRHPLERWGAWGDDHPVTGRPCKWRGVAGMSQYLTKDEDADHVFPAISAYITAHARVWMDSIIRQLPRGSVYYTATDSLICSEFAFSLLRKMGHVSDSQLGKFRLIGDYRDGEIVGCNHYRLGDTAVVAGLHGRAKVLPDGRRLAEIWDRVGTIIATGPREDIGVSRVELLKMNNDMKGTIDQHGYWHPYILHLDANIRERAQFGGYTLADDWPTTESLDPGRGFDRW